MNLMGFKRHTKGGRWLVFGLRLVIVGAEVAVYFLKLDKYCKIYPAY
jgi:hypothetical protein